jgi:DNA polymerase III subunit gamma/tau
VNDHLTSLHVKYRPSSFEEVIGQGAVINSLKKIVKNERAKVFLFHGPAGTGKTTLGRILANVFCNGQATAANVIEVPAAVYTGADSVRQIIDKTHTRAIGASPIKVIILDESHRLSGTAWDSLLKAIEEPPAHVYYVFCTTNVDKIPKTIRTRCADFRLNPLTEDEIIEVLINVIDQEGMEVDPEVIEVISENSEGSPRQALIYLEKCAHCTTANEARRVMQKAGETKEIIDLCRLLISPKKPPWKEIQRCLEDLKETEAESIRIIVVNYFATAILNNKSDNFIRECLRKLDCFSSPYNASDKFAPLLLSIGLALKMNE